MFDGLLKSKFYAKCKADIKLIKTRVEMIKKKRSAMQKYLRNDVADLLKNGLDINAYGRAEGLLAELNRSCCYEFVEQCCVHVLNNLAAMNKQRECPEECREAVASLMFAAARFADLPELRDLRTAFAERYGNSLDLFVNKQFVDKLKSSGLPSKDLKLQLLQEIAAESGLEWNTKALENKLYHEPAGVKDSDKEINKGYSLHDNVNGSIPRKNSSVGYEFRNPREYVAPDRKENFTHNGQKEAITIEDKLPRKKDSFAPPRYDVAPPPVTKRPYEVPPVKDIQVDSNIKTEKHKEITTVPKKAEHEKKLLRYGSIPPPYTKCEINKAESSLRDDDEKDEDAPGKAKPMPKSVRRRNLKPPPGTSGSESDEREKFKDVNKEKAALQGQRVLKFFDEGGGCAQDEEEKMMDKLLRHYSKKRDPHEKIKSGAILKPPPHHDPTGSSEGTKHRTRDGPARASSLPTELVSPPETPRRHARANSFQPDAGNVHVHPKLPDYDDFVARLAALRGK